MMTKTVYLATHGITSQGVPDPLMDGEGVQQVRDLIPTLKRCFTNCPSQIQIGTGRRQDQVLQVLQEQGLFLEQAVFVSDVWGGSATMLRKNEQGKLEILLSSGRVVVEDYYLSSKLFSGAIVSALSELTDNSLICSGRPVLHRLSLAMGWDLPVEQMKSGALYALRINVFSDADIDAMLDIAVPGILHDGNVKIMLELLQDGVVLIK